MSSFSPAIVSRKRLFRAFIDDTDSTVQSTQDELSSQDYGSPAIDEQPAGSHLQHDGSEIDPAPGGSRLRHDDSQIDWPETQQEGQTQIHTSTVLDELSAERNQQNLDPGDGQAPGSALLHDDDPQIDWRTTQTQCGLAEQDDEDDLEFETPTTPTFCYGIPKTIQDAHGSLTTCTTRMEPEYSAFVKQLCEETATRCVEAPLLLGVQYAIGKAISITLDQRLVDEPLMYAFALIVHVWQVVFQRSQHGAYPDATESLALQWASYFHAAHSIVGAKFSCETEPSVSRFRFAVQYWEADWWKRAE